MLPATLALDVKKQVLHYLEATFPMRDSEAEAALGQFFQDPDKGLFKGPWLQLKRPFSPAPDSNKKFFDLDVPFEPFRHQWRAWDRLSSKDQFPKPTLITTGTGSGKTECFLFPMLDHCLRLKKEGKTSGIKGIVLYPMNALASDQAGRFAEEILTSDQLSYEADVNGTQRRKALVRVGIYTGRMQPGREDREAADQGTYHEMQILAPSTPTGKPVYVAINNREVLQSDPPDILLTNYRMLDYLLMRPKDQRIWKHNLNDSSLLRYLVLDEMHTYDGAQGADVACLIRRLKEHLSIAKEELCAIGTSATMTGGDDETLLDPLNHLCNFADSLFEEVIGNDAVIDEEREPIERIIRVVNEKATLPSANVCLPLFQETAPQFVCRVAPFFGGPAFSEKSSLDDHRALDKWGVDLGDWVRSHPLFHQLLKITHDGAVPWVTLVKTLSRDDFDFRKVGHFQEREQVLQAFLALVSHARVKRSEKVFPLVPTQVQFWMRELRRIGRFVSEIPVFSWLDEATDKKQLPTVQCTECGESGWVALVDPDQTSSIEEHVAGFALIDDVPKIYQGWGFEKHPASQHLVVFSVWPEGDDPLPRESDQQGGQNLQLTLEGTRYFVSPQSLVVREGPGLCPLTGGPTFPIKMSKELRTQEHSGLKHGVRRCPHCQAEDSLMFIGGRAATVASVAIDEVFGSTLNSDPKLLAFTDSVQDASHRAGFFSSRTYHFSFRTALQHIVDDAGPQGLPLEEVGERLLIYWSEKEPGRPGSLKEVVATLLPPDLREYGPYLTYRNDSTVSTPSEPLRTQFVERLNWQATSEFSLMLNHGRTMEVHASSTLGWDAKAIQKTVENLKQKLPSISPLFSKIGDSVWALWIYGILHRSRERGGLYHPYLDPLARRFEWGKTFTRRGRKFALPEREIYPPAQHFRPRLLVTHKDSYHDHVLAPNKTKRNAPWQIVWARRTLNEKGVLDAVEDNALLDLLKALMRAGTEAGLFKCVHQDGEKAFYALNSKAARLFPTGQKVTCNTTGQTLFRPPEEAALWINSPSMDYRDEQGRYHHAELNDRERYYRDRYRKGALRRVFAHEHTGLLTTEEREALEMSFNKGGHADDPNVLTATSTLEMGIDIGDLSTTMLCSIPPSVASYLQRIGRAGRSTGTALVLSVINQRPHDLFFYARPQELLDGRVEPPGCWLDASAVLERQYLAYCLDRAVKEQVIADLPLSGRQLIEEVVNTHSGHIPTLMNWMSENEVDLQQSFLARFNGDTKPDTDERFTEETRIENIRYKIASAAVEFDKQQQMLWQAKLRLEEQLKEKGSGLDKETLEEIEREGRILKARTRKLNEISALEVLIEHGLLPNYAFPERGVRFSGTTYNQHSQSPETDRQLKTYELVRSGVSAIRELAPANHFYSHRHVFDIQQLEVGNSSFPLLEEYGICGQCGHMRTSEELNAPDSPPNCPQCGHDGIQGQKELGQRQQCLPFHRSQAVSYVEYYQSLSGDRGEERNSEYYKVVTSFDHSLSKMSGVVAEENLPFGIEYRDSILLRELNTGYLDQSNEVAFSQDVDVPQGFEVCGDCGVVLEPQQNRKAAKHRKSCAGRIRESRQSQGGKGDGHYDWKRLWLYRELRSEAIRLLLPEVEKADLDTLEACIYFGMRLHFQGDPAHLMVNPQVIPDQRTGITAHYLVLVDAVPGGTGFLKSLYQNEEGMDGEGLMRVLRLAKNALETCECQQIHQTEDDTDGCYRCIRTFHMQHRAQNISRDRGIDLLEQLLTAGEERKESKSLDDIQVLSRLGSVLEKRFLQRLESWVKDQGGQWNPSKLKGPDSIEFVVGNPEHVWNMESQPKLGPAQQVSIPCQPDFMLSCKTSGIKPIAIFTDGYEFHVQPEKSHSRLRDDVEKRRAIWESGHYRVWALGWDDLEKKESAHLEFIKSAMVQTPLNNKAKTLRRMDKPCPDIKLLSGNPWMQLQAFLLCPVENSWRYLVEDSIGYLMNLAASKGITTSQEDLINVFKNWQTGYNQPALQDQNQEPWYWISLLNQSEDLWCYAKTEELETDEFQQIRFVLRLDDNQLVREKSDYKQRWRRFMGLFNLFQFATNFTVFSTSEAGDLSGPQIEMSTQAISEDWEEILEESVPSQEPLIRALARCTPPKALPEVAYELDDQEDEITAELAWPDSEPPLAFLVQDQVICAQIWQSSGWKVITDQTIQVQGQDLLIQSTPNAHSGE